MSDGFARVCYEAPTLLRLAVLSLVLWLAPGLALAAAPRVEDRAGLFQPQTIEAANRVIEKIYAETGPPPKDVLVKTVGTLPPGKDVKEAAEAEFAARRINGMMLFLVKSPGKLWITVGAETQRGFPKADMDELVNAVMLPRLRERKSDQALLDGLRFVERKFQVFRAATPVTRGAASALPAAGKAESGGLLGGVNRLWVVVVVLAAWVVVGLVRAVLRPRATPGTSTAPGLTAGQGSNPAPTAGAPSGGGWGTAILGGVLGAMAGNWLYGTLFGGSSGLGGGGTAYAGTNPTSAVAAADEGRTGVGGGADTDFSTETASGGAGGDFDSGGGGGVDFASDGGDFGGMDEA